MRPQHKQVVFGKVVWHWPHKEVRRVAVALLVPVQHLTALRLVGHRGVVVDVPRTQHDLLRRVAEVEFAHNQSIRDADASDSPIQSRRRTAQVIPEPLPVGGDKARGVERGVGDAVVAVLKEQAEGPGSTKEDTHRRDLRRRGELCANTTIHGGLRAGRLEVVVKSLACRAASVGEGCACLSEHRAAIERQHRVRVGRQDNLHFVKITRHQRHLTLPKLDAAIDETCKHEADLIERLLDNLTGQFRWRNTRARARLFHKLDRCVGPDLPGVVANQGHAKASLLHARLDDPYDKGL